MNNKLMQMFSRIKSPGNLGLLYCIYVYIIYTIYTRMMNKSNKLNKQLMMSVLHSNVLHVPVMTHTMIFTSEQQKEVYTCICICIYQRKYVTPHHQMRHKSQIQKLRFWNNMKEDNTSFKMVKELCFYHN